MGPFDTAQIRIDGMTVRWITNAAGQSNWPEIKLPGGGGNAGGPALVVSSADFHLQDDLERRCSPASRPATPPALGMLPAPNTQFSAKQPRDRSNGRAPDSLLIACR